MGKPPGGAQTLSSTCRLPSSQRETPCRRRPGECPSGTSLRHRPDRLSSTAATLSWPPRNLPARVSSPGPMPGPKVRFSFAHARLGEVRFCKAFCIPARRPRRKTPKWTAQVEIPKWRVLRCWMKRPTPRPTPPEPAGMSPMRLADAQSLGWIYSSSLSRTRVGVYGAVRNFASQPADPEEKSAHMAGPSSRIPIGVSRLAGSRDLHAGPQRESGADRASGPAQGRSVHCPASGQAFTA